MLLELRPKKKKPVLGTGEGRVLGQKKQHIKDPEMVCVLERVARMLLKMREGLRSEVWQGPDHMGHVGQV